MVPVLSGFGSTAVTSLADHRAWQGLVYDRTLDQEATWQQRFIIEAREDKEQIESLQAELEM